MVQNKIPNRINKIKKPRVYSFKIQFYFIRIQTVFNPKSAYRCPSPRVVLHSFTKNCAEFNSIKNIKNKKQGRCSSEKFQGI